MQQVPLALAPPPPPTLTSFVPGANAAVLQHLQLLASQRGAGAAPHAATPPPVYVWGPSGSGKTHLLIGLAAQFSAVQPGWANAKNGCSAVAWFTPQTALPWQLPAGTQLVLLDNCDQLSGPAQHAAFVLFNETTALGLPLVAAGQLPPVDLPLRDDLRTRLGWGHVFALQPLSEGETQLALQAEAQRRGFALEDGVAAYLMARFPRDLSHLMHLLSALDHFGLVKGRRVTVPLVRDMLAEDALPDIFQPTP
jgi:DnaA-homolog protein